MLEVLTQANPMISREVLSCVSNGGCVTQKGGYQEGRLNPEEQKEKV